MYANVRNLCSTNSHILEEDSYYCLCLVIHVLIESETSRKTEK